MYEEIKNSQKQEVVCDKPVEDLPGEIWKDIPFTEGYQVSNMGRVKSFKLSRFGKLMKLTMSNKGYLRVGLKDKETKKTKQCSIHRLVLMIFNPIPGMEDLEVNHRDEDKTNNRLDNLEWCERKYNANHGKAIEKVAAQRRKPVKCVETGEVFSCAKEAGEAYGVGASAISASARDVTRRSAGLHWTYNTEE